MHSVFKYNMNNNNWTREKTYHAVKIEYEMVDLGKVRTGMLNYLTDERYKYNQQLDLNAKLNKDLSQCRGEQGFKKFWKELTGPQATVIASVSGGAYTLLKVFGFI